MQSAISTKINTLVSTPPAVRRFHQPTVLHGLLVKHSFCWASHVFCFFFCDRNLFSPELLRWSVCSRIGLLASPRPGLPHLCHQPAPPEILCVTLTRTFSPYKRESPFLPGGATSLSPSPPLPPVLWCPTNVLRQIVTQITHQFYHTVQWCRILIHLCLKLLYHLDPHFCWCGFWPFSLSSSFTCMRTRKERKKM